MTRWRLLGLLLALGAGLPPTTAEAGETRHDFRLRPFRYESADGHFQLRVGGRLMIDGARFDDDRASREDGVGVRRARLELAATWRRDWQVVSSLELAGADPDFKNLWVGYRGWRRTRLRLGQIQEPFSLEELTSSNDLTFLERALPSVLAPGYHLGVDAQTHGGRWSAAAGLFGRALGAAEGEGWGTTGRFSFAALDRGDRALHFGIAASYRRPGGGTVRFRPRPEAQLADRRLLDSGRIGDVEHHWLAGFESAAVFGSLSFQGELMRAELRREAGRGSAVEQGWYVFGSWFPTGEHRRYNAARGTFGAVRPRHGFGAVELALRYSRLDLEDRRHETETGEIVTLGVNWYLGRSLRVMVDYSDFQAAERFGDDRPSALQARVQLMLR